MKKAPIVSLILVLVMTMRANGAAPEKPAFIGVFSNKEDGFDTKAIMLMEDGKGVLSLAVASVPVVWKLGPTNGDIILTGPFDNLKNLVVHFDSAKKTITILDKEVAEDSGPLFFITNEIPNVKELQKKLRHFDGTKESLDPKYAVFAISLTNHLDDLVKLQKTVHDQQLPCALTGDPKLLLVDMRDFEELRKLATNEISDDSLSVRIRGSKDTSDFEVWEKGKKIRVEPYNFGDLTNPVVPVNLE